MVLVAVAIGAAAVELGAHRGAARFLTGIAGQRYKGVYACLYGVKHDVGYLASGHPRFAVSDVVMVAAVPGLVSRHDLASLVMHNDDQRPRPAHARGAGPSRIPTEIGATAYAEPYGSHRRW